jgi:protein TonB
MSKKKEIKTYFAALTLSITIHVLVLLFIIIFSKTSLNSNKIVVIDLTLMNPVTAEAGVSGDKNESDTFEPRKKFQKFAVDDNEPVKGQTKQEAKEGTATKEKEEKAVTEVEITRVHEIPKEEKQVTAVKTASLFQDNEENNVPEYQSRSKRVGTFLGRSGESSVSLSSDGYENSLHTGYVYTESSGSSGDASKARYTKEDFSYVINILQGNLQYPELAIEKGWTGKVEVSFNITASGYVEDVKVSKSSGHEILDEEAIKLVERFSPFPKPPGAAKLKIPILYELKKNQNKNKKPEFSSDEVTLR